MLFPFLWMLSSSFKTQVDIIAWPPKFFFTPTLQNYEQVFGEQDFLKYFLNSTIVGATAVGLSLLLGLPAAYSIARFTQKQALGVHPGGAPDAGNLLPDALVHHLLAAGPHGQLHRR